MHKIIFFPLFLTWKHFTNKLFPLLIIQHRSLFYIYLVKNFAISTWCYTDMKRVCHDKEREEGMIKKLDKKTHVNRKLNSIQLILYLLQCQSLCFEHQCWHEEEGNTTENAKYPKWPMCAKGGIESTKIFGNKKAKDPTTRGHNRRCLGFNFRRKNFSMNSPRYWAESHAIDKNKCNHCYKRQPRKGRNDICIVTIKKEIDS